IFTSSETLTDNQRNVIERVFNSEIYDYYGNGEQISSAFQCAEGNYHINEVYSFTEIVNSEVIGTNLYNKLFPLIRYNVGDSMELSDRGCKCGSNFLIVKNISGRTGTNYIITPEGTKISDLNQIIKYATN